mgnify:CR=1 FL=1
MEYNFEDYPLREKELLVTVSHVSVIVKNSNSARYIRLGFMNRFFMLQIARNKIIKIIFEQNGIPLQGEDTSWLKLLLNSYYINLRGALDNLAWFLNYEFQLQENIIEETGKGSSFSFTDLLGTEFLKKLKSKEQLFSEELEHYQDWYFNLKKFRDPAAHRIPLSFVHSTLTENDFNKAKFLSSKWEIINNNFSDGNFSQVEEADQILKEYSQLGHFDPIIISSRASNFEYHPAPKRLDQDHNEFLSISEIVLKNILITT